MNPSPRLFFRSAFAFALRLVALAGAMALIGIAHASVVKCIDADGRVSYQDSTCAGGAKGQAVDATPNSGGRFATEREIRDARRAAATAAAAENRPPPAVRTSARKKPTHGYNADERRFIQVGMSEAEVRRRIGAPDHAVRRSSAPEKSSTRSRDSTLQWIYGPADADPQTTTTLTFKGGAVIHIDRRITR